MLIEYLSVMFILLLCPKRMLVLVITYTFISYPQLFPQQHLLIPFLQLYIFLRPYEGQKPKKC